MGKVIEKVSKTTVSTADILIFRYALKISRISLLFSFW